MSTHLCFAVITAVITASEAHEGEPLQSARIELGDLSVQFRDNSQSPRMLSGISELLNTRHAADYDAWDPGTRGASAGLNFEHIITGHPNLNNKFSPRHGQYTLRALSDGNSVLLTRRAEHSPWKMASTLKYTATPPHYIDFEFRCTPQDASLFGPRGYAVLFFANYMNDVEDISLHFRGHKSAGAPEQWITADAPKGHPDWNGGGNYRALSANDLEYDEDVKFRLNTWSYDWPRIAKPFYYGRAAHGMTLILMFDRLYSDRDQIRFSLYKFKLPTHPRPAWDFQYVINQAESGTEYGFRGRLVWKQFVSDQNCLDEYRRWSSTLTTERPRIQAECIRRLKKLGVSVFTRGNDVVEVNANRTTIEDQDIALVSGFRQMTDLSLEETVIGNTGLIQLRHLQKLEWLNLYRTQTGNDGLKELRHLTSLQYLPVGETKVTNTGLAHLSNMRQLVYLGLRGNNVTDDGVKHLRNLVNLTGLHLGETKVTDTGITYLQQMSRLQTLWLDKTAVSNEAIGALGALTSLRELHIAETKITPAGLRRLTTLLPRCQILD